MNRKTMFSLLAVVGLLLLITAVLLTPPQQIQAQEPTAEGGVTPLENIGTAFSYQGRLTDGGSPANGDYDFEFKLYDAAGDGAGNQVGSTVTIDDQNVTDGLFTVQLDFGAAAFIGDARWLEIGVRAGSSTGAYTPLSPRQSLTATPYALSLKPGAQVTGNTGVVPALSVENTNSTAGFGLVGKTDADTVGAGVYGLATSSSGQVHGVWGASNSTSGYGVYGENSGGVALMAGGSGIIKSKADSVLYLSPHDMVVRGGSGPAVEVTPLDNGGVKIQYHDPGVEYYLSIPVSTFGTLFGSRLYIKEVEVCYKNGTGSAGYISVTSVRKNNGGTGSVAYLQDETDRSNTTYSCYTASASTPLEIDNSTWVQFNIPNSDFGTTYIYTVNLTLTETP